MKPSVKRKKTSVQTRQPKVGSWKISESLSPAAATTWVDPPNAPRAVVAAPVYNKADFLPAALESLLAQSYENFALLVVDDRSTDATPEIVEQYARRDARVFSFRNPERLGMIDNKRRCFSLARELFPEAPYFAWGSDHDYWRREWLAALIDVFEETPEAVCAYPKSIRIDEHGRVIRRPWSFETRGVRSPARRMRMCCSGLASGFMVYGLYRAEALEQIDTMSHVIEPDRLLLYELALLGEFVQVEDVLWERRFGGISNPARQRASFFPSGRAPWYTWLSPWLTHVGALFWRYAVLGKGKPEVGRLRALALIPQFVLATLANRAHRKAVRVRNRPRKRARLHSTA
jgi:glycosyltransferase involved in cell wall biosynthesis